LLDTGHATTDNCDRIANAFVAARREGASIGNYPGEVPDDFAAAYQIQERAIALDGRAIAGWKVGRVNSPLDETYGVTRLVGPIFDGNVQQAAQPSTTMPVYAGGFAAVEAELLLRVDSLPVGDPSALDDAGIMAHIGAVHVGIEIASSPYAGINRDGPLVTASDFGNNAGLICGPELPDWRTRDLREVTASVAIDGAEVGRGDMRALPGGPIESVRFLLTHLATRTSAMPLPFWVSAGAISGVHPIDIGSAAVASFDDAQSINCHIVAATAQ
jgi:2-keto-4-pentenoate hydratase